MMNRTEQFDDVQLIEVKELSVLCGWEGEKNISAMLAPWDEDGYILMFKLVDRVYILRTKADPIPRIFKSADTALNICKEAGLSKVTVTFISNEIGYKKPKWIVKNN